MTAKTFPPNVNLATLPELCESLHSLYKTCKGQQQKRQPAHRAWKFLCMYIKTKNTSKIVLNRSVCLLNNEASMDVPNNCSSFNGHMRLAPKASRSPLTLVVHCNTSMLHIKHGSHIKLTTVVKLDVTITV